MTPHGHPGLTFDEREEGSPPIGVSHTPFSPIGLSYVPDPNRCSPNGDLRARGEPSQSGGHTLSYSQIGLSCPGLRERKQNLPNWEVTHSLAAQSAFS